MKNKYLVKTIALLLAVCIGTVGCSAGQGKNIKVEKMEPEKSHAVTVNITGGDDVMPITGYIGPYAHTQYTDGDGFQDLISDEIFKKISDVGINLIVYTETDYATNSELMDKYLDLAEKYNIGVFITDTSVTNNKGNSSYTAEQATESIAKYYDSPAFSGMYIIDEPDTSYYMIGGGQRMLDDYKQLAKVLQEDLDLLCYLNMLPIDNYDRDKENYERYVAEFCEVYNPKVLMWDYYVYDDYASDEVYFWNMDLIRKHALENDVPFWAFIQAGGQWNGEWKYFDSEPYYPNEAEFDWNVNTCLAFGAQGIQYFPLIQPAHFAFAKTTDWDFQRNGILGAAGNQTQWYHYAQKMNEQIAAIDEVLMASVTKGVIASGKQAKEDLKLTECVIESGQFQELISVEGNALVGCFNYNGQTALYVVNYSREYAQHVTLDFNEKHNIRMIQNAESSYVNAQELTLDMAAGEGVLLVIE